MKLSTPVSPAHVKAECETRILARYDVYRQMNLMRAGGADLDDMDAFINAMRSRSNAIEAMSPIPADYSSDKYWKAQ